MENELIQEETLLFMDVCARIESLCAELYHFYSQLFSEHDDAARLWKKTALEEENHHNQIKMAMRMSDEIKTLMPDGLTRAYPIYKKLHSLVVGVQSNPPDLITALKKSIEMEEKLSHLHVDSAVKFKDDSVQKMFNVLQGADRDHVAALKHQLAIESLAHTEMRG